MIAANDPEPQVEKPKITYGAWSWLPWCDKDKKICWYMGDVDVYKFSVYWNATDPENASKASYNLEVLANDWGDGRLGKLHKKMDYYLDLEPNGRNITNLDVQIYEKMIAESPYNGR